MLTALVLKLRLRFTTLSTHTCDGSPCMMGRLNFTPAGGRSFLARRHGDRSEHIWWHLWMRHYVLPHCERTMHLETIHFLFMTSDATFSPAQTHLLLKNVKLN